MKNSGMSDGVTRNFERFALDVWKTQMGNGTTLSMKEVNDADYVIQFEWRVAA